MSYRTAFYEVSVSRDQLLDLFFGRGNLLITLEEQTITLQKIYDLILMRDGEGGELYSTKIEGISDNPHVTAVDGVGTLELSNHNTNIFILDLILHLQDDWE